MKILLNHQYLKANEKKSEFYCLIHVACCYSGSGESRGGARAPFILGEKKKKWLKEEKPAEQVK